MKKVAVVTGIRSEFNILLPVLKQLQKNPDFKLGIIACGTHLVDAYGYTVQLIEREGFPIIDRIDYVLYSNTDAGRAKGLAILLEGLVNCVNRTKPDFLLVVGDREEAIATGIVGNYLKIPVIHIGGGDEAQKNADDPIRHATSKLAHIHCTTCERYKQNLIKIGEEAFRVHNVGNPGLDTIKSTEIVSRKELSSLIDFEIANEPEPLLLVLQHPLSSESDKSYEQMKTTMEAIYDLEMKSIVIYPNSDPGSSEIIRAIEEFRDISYIKIVQNLDNVLFVNSLYHANCMIGNSSSGFLEAPFLKKPVINIGNRQTGRINAGNVIYVPHDKNKIIHVVNRIVHNKEYLQDIMDKTNQFYYGDGNSASRIVALIRRTDPRDPILLNKRNVWG